MLILNIHLNLQSKFLGVLFFVPLLPSRVELLEKGRLKGKGERLGKEGGGGGATIFGLGGGALMVL